MTTKYQLRKWEKERLIEEVIKLQKANESLADKIFYAGIHLEKAQEKLVLN